MVASRVESRVRARAPIGPLRREPSPHSLHVVRSPGQRFCVPLTIREREEVAAV